MEGVAAERRTEEKKQGYMSNQRKPSPVPTYLLIGFLAVLAVLTGYNYFFQPFASSKQQQFEETTQSTPTAAPTQQKFQNKQEEIAALVANMTPDQKVAQLLAAPVNAQELVATFSARAVMYERAQESDPYVSFLDGSAPTSVEQQPGLLTIEEYFLKDWGFVTLFGTNISVDEARAAILFLKSGDTEPVDRWILVDHEGGTVQRLSGAGFTDLPSWQQYCQTELPERIPLLTASAAELKGIGVDAVLAPMLDISTNHPVLKTRVCSGDPLIVFEAVKEFVTIFNENQVLPVLKHFPGIGSTTKDLHVASDSVTVSDNDVSLYRAVLDVYPYSAVMVSHAAVQSQDSTQPCSLSRDCVGQIYAEYPDVLTFSDALEMQSTGIDNKEVFLEDVALQAVQAGTTVLVFGEGVSQSELKIVHERLVREYTNSFEFRELVNQNVARILQYKLAK